jgi:hypothetical protein
LAYPKNEMVFSLSSCKVITCRFVLRSRKLRRYYQQEEGHQKHYHLKESGQNKQQIFDLQKLENE